MNIILSLWVLFISTAVTAQVKPIAPIVLSTEDEGGNRRFNHEKGHWLFSIGVEGSKYDVPFNFTGARRTIKPERQDLWGARLGIGKEFFLRPGILTSFKVEGYFHGMLDSTTFNGGDDEDAEPFSRYYREGQLYGADAVQSLGYMFHMKTKNPMMEEMTYLTIEPYVNAGVGLAYARNRIDYSFDTGPDPSGAQESYKQTLEDDLVNFRLGAGVNFTSNQGFYFYASVIQNNFNMLQRKIKGISQPPNGSPAVNLDKTQKSLGIDESLFYSIGGGLKF